MRYVLRVTLIFIQLQGFWLAVIEGVYLVANVALPGWALLQKTQSYLYNYVYNYL